MKDNFIIGASIIAIFISLYVIDISGGGELVRNAFSKKNQNTSTSNYPTVSSVTGIYSCNKESGCTRKYTFMLKEDKSLELISSIDVEEEDTNDSSSQNSFNEKSKSKPAEERSSIIVNESIPVSSPINENEGQTGDDPQTQSSTTTDTTSTTTETTNEENPTEIVQNETTNEETNSTDDVKIKVKGLVIKGTWDIIPSGHLLIITLNQQGTTTLETPQKFIIKKIEASALSKISYNREQYKDMIKPTFIREDY